MPTNQQIRQLARQYVADDVANGEIVLDASNPKQDRNQRVARWEAVLRERHLQGIALTVEPGKNFPYCY